ncbi:MAG: ABC transporter permease [Lachnoclostridium edouardi]|uniref:ABC transporter permease n=1 Tax=Lachnoclostridium edouardi TaxID=1926283 RepID=UPI0026DDBA7E|nr:ABC transporter permease [Lachnoclostridium edouardi]MDO4279726.1 ABC transporter permease [Lachnoclostridium edouardi]
MGDTIKKQMSFGAMQRIAVAFGAAAVYILLIIFIPNFSSSYNLFNIITQASIYGTMSLGLGFVLITGGIDISLPYILAMGSVVGVTFMSRTGNWAAGCLIILAVCLLGGLVNGISVAIFKMSPMIVTLAMMNIADGFSKWYTNYESVRGIPEVLTNFFKNRIGGIVPVYVLVFLSLVLILHFILVKTVLGRWLYFVGTNKNTARVSGVPVSLVTISAYLIGAFMAGIAGIMLSVQSGCATARMVSPSMLTEVLAAAVIGGASDRGGRGTAIGVAIGAIVISTTSISLNLLGIQSYLAQVIKGGIIVLATVLDYRLNNGAVGKVKNK